MTRQYDHQKGCLYILRDGNPETADLLEGVEFSCSQHGAGSLKSTTSLDFWGLKDGDTVALTYKEYGSQDVYREDELIVKIDDISINYKRIEKTNVGFGIMVNFVGNFTWALGVKND